jgi:hypothetical protein
LPLSRSKKKAIEVKANADLLAVANAALRFHPHLHELGTDL